MSMIQEFRHGLRLLGRNRGFAAIGILTLALGIGANTAMFSIVNGVLLNPFPYPATDSLMFVSAWSAQFNVSVPLTYADYLDLRHDSRLFQHLAAARGSGFNLTEAAREPARVKGATVSANAFPLLGMQPALGRTLQEADDREGAERVAVISHALWTTRYDGDPGVIGRSIGLDGQTYTVVGVMPAAFKFWAADVWVPIGLNFLGEFQHSRVVRSDMFGVGRLAPGVTREQAQAELDVITKRLQQAYPDTNRDIGVRVVPLKESVTASIRPTLLVLLGAVGFVLLIACANVANLLLARAATRERELAVRTALGASRGRLARQLLFEAAPLALLGATAGLVLAHWFTQGALRLAPAGSIPAEAAVGVDWRVLAFTVGISFLTAFGTGLLPALQAARTDPARDLSDGARGATAGGRAHLARSALVVSEVALSLVLLAGATLLMTSFKRLQAEDPGFRPDHILTLQVSLPATRYPEAHQSERFFTDALDRIGSLPGVQAVGAVSALPLSGTGSDMPIVAEGRTYTSLDQLPSTQFSVVQGDYFRAMGMAVRAGRVFNAGDTVHAPRVTVINEALAKQFLPGNNPIGKRVMLGVPDNLMRDDLIPGIKRFEWLTVVGVVGNVKKFALGDTPTPEAYVPYVQSPPIAIFRSSMFIVARSTGEPLALAAALRDQIWALDRDQPITSLMTMDGRLAESLRQPRFSMLLLGLFAVVALVLSLVGIYGVLSYLVASRTREIGIRLALGAQPAHVVRGVITQALWLVGGGVALGLAGSFALTRLLTSMLHDVSPTDPGVLGGVAALLVTAALAACYVPARRATRVEPVIALRAE